MTAPAPQCQPITIDGRTIRARKFASQIMAIIGDCVSDKVGAESRLIHAAYTADAQITTGTNAWVRDVLKRAYRAIKPQDGGNCEHGIAKVNCGICVPSEVFSKPQDGGESGR